jgi:phage terminase large subunit
MTQIDIDVTPVFTANRKAYERGYRRISNQGSTRSSKTFSLVQLMTNVALSETKKEISICSPSLTHLKKGARKDFLDQMEASGLFKEEEFNRTDNLYTFKRTGSYIEFFGADEAGRLRGPGRDILYINEANLIPEESYTQLAIRTKQTIFVDYNPADEFSYVYGLAEGQDSKFIHSTYRNNLANLTKAQIDEIERLKDVDENLWKVFGLGLRGTSAETIYTHWKYCKGLPLKGELFMGMDFGFNVPTALIMIEYYEGAVYWDEWLFETKLTTSELVERMGPNGLDVSRTIEIFCDNAEPKTIQEICNAGFNAMPADKDVREGIRKVKGMPLYITERSANLIKEIKSYKWKTNKDGKVLDEPVKMNDHGMDAGRYGTFTKLTRYSAGWDALE